MILTGRVRQRTYQTQDGKRTVYKLEVTDIGTFTLGSNSKGQTPPPQS